MLLIQMLSWWNSKLQCLTSLPKRYRSFIFSRSISCFCTVSTSREINCMHKGGETFSFQSFILLHACPLVTSFFLLKYVHSLQENTLLGKFSGDWVLLFESLLLITIYIWVVCCVSNTYHLFPPWCCIFPSSYQICSSTKFYCYICSGFCELNLSCHLIINFGDLKHEWTSNYYFFRPHFQVHIIFCFMPEQRPANGQVSTANAVWSHINEVLKQVHCNRS